MATFVPIQFGKYKLIEPIAQGGMAEIFLARQQGPRGYEKSVVIKRVLSHYSAQADFVEMFLDEARLAANLSHPNIVQIFDFGEVDGTYYLCMEHLRGEDLHTLNKQTRAKGAHVPPQIAATLVSAACEALHYAHTLTAEDGSPLNIVHRDISPSNLYVTYQGVVKVLDFGIARAEGRVVKTATGVVKGKIAYMAPEQARGHDVDGRSDVWSLGAVLFELLTGKRLFWRGNEVESLHALIQEPIPKPSDLVPGIPAELDAVCVAALQRDVSQRLSTAQAMYAELDDYLSSRTYQPAQTLLKSYLEHIIGKDVVAERMKLPSAIRQVIGTPLESPAGAQLATPASNPESSHRPTVTAKPALAIRPKPSRWLYAMLFMIVIVAGGTGAMLTRWSSQPSAVSPVALPQPKPQEPPAVDARPAVTPPPVVVDHAHDVQPIVEHDAGTVEAIVKNTEPPKAQRGLLDINCVPWCHLYIDGKDSNRDSPVIGLELRAGKHHLRVVNPPANLSQELDVAVKPGTTVREVVRF